MKDERKKRGRKSAKKKRALRRRRRMALIAGFLAAVLLAMAVNAAPGLAGYAWGAAALAAAVEAILLALRRGVPAGLYVLIGALCVALVALGVATRDLVFADKGIVPRESLVTELTVTDRWPDHIERYTGLETLDLRNSTVTDFSPVLRMRSLRALDARGNAAFDEATYAEISAALPECAIDWSMSLAGRYYDSGTTEVDLSGTGLDADEITELQAEHPDIDFTYTVPLMGKEIDPAATAIDLRGAETVDPDAILAALSLLPNAKRVDLRDAPVTLDVAEALMNGCLIVINIYNLIKLLKTTDTKNYELVTGEVREGFFKYFIDHYGSDIAAFFPDFNKSGAQGNVAYAIMCEENPAGIFLGRAGKNGEINIILDYTTPAYRDCSAGRFLIQELKKQGYKRLIFNNQADKHKNYLDKMGYRKTDKGYIKEL